MFDNNTINDKNIMNNLYWVELSTDIWCNYFVTDVEDNRTEYENGNKQPNCEFLEEEISGVGYNDLFSFSNELKDFKFEPKSKYKTTWKVIIDRDYYGEIEELIQK